MKMNWLNFLSSYNLKGVKKDKNLDELACIVDYALTGFNNPIKKSDNTFICEDDNGLPAIGDILNNRSYSCIEIYNDITDIKIITSKNDIKLCLKRNSYEDQKRICDKEKIVVSYDFLNYCKYKSTSDSSDLNLGLIPDDVEIIEILRDYDNPTTIRFGKQICNKNIYSDWEPTDNSLPLTFIALQNKDLNTTKQKCLRKSMEK